MNTTQRGETFEDTIYRLIERQITEGRFWARPECCRIFRRKGYYSKDRQKDIIFDVSIEITLPGEDSYSVLVLIECKDYSNTVPVNDLEEFWAKIEQVAGANVKGVVASTAAFQEGGLRYAESKGFGILRHFGQGEFKWVLKRSASWSGSDSRAESRDVRRAMTAEHYVSDYYDFCFFAKGTFTYSSNRMFEALCLGGGSPDQEFIARISSPNKEMRPTVPYVEKNDIEQAAGECLTRIGYIAGPVDLSSICEWQQHECGLSVKYEGSGAGEDGTLGTLAFHPAQISIFSNDRGSARSRFTLAHELGHLLMMHDRFMVSEFTHESDLQRDSYSRLEFVDLRRMEWQANFFASCLLLPSARFVAHLFGLAQELDLHDRGFGLLYVDHQPVNQKNFYMVTDSLSSSFNVSRQATEIRLKELGYLNDVRHESGLQRLLADSI